MKTPNRWVSQVKTDLDFARQTLLERGEVRPMFGILSDENELLLIPGNWENDAEKDRFSSLIRVIALAYDAQSVSFMTEAWSRNVERRIGESEAEHEARVDAIRPSEAEDRIEMVIVVLQYRDTNSRLHLATGRGEILRSADGKPTGLTEPDVTSETLTGRFADFMPRKRPNAEERARAKATLVRGGVVLQPIPRPS